MTTETQSVERVLVALDTLERNFDTLEIATEFAALLQVQLNVLFIEDVNLLKLSELPFAKELDPSSGTLRPLESDRVISALQSNVRILQHRLDEEIQKYRINVSTEVIRGHYLSTAKKMTRERDALVLSYAGVPAPSMKSFAGGKPAASARPRGCVWVVHDESDRDYRCLQLGLSLCQHSGAELVVVASGNADKSTLEDRLRSLTTVPQQSQYTVLAAPDETLLTRTFFTKGCAVMILPRGLDPKKSIGPYLQRIKSPAILV